MEALTCAGKSGRNSAQKSGGRSAVAALSDLPADSQGVDGFIIEAKPPPGATRPGGNAVTMAWGLLDGWQAPAPWLLAGGLNASNVLRAIAETARARRGRGLGRGDRTGSKSAGIIRDFVARARSGGKQ